MHEFHSYLAYPYHYLVRLRQRLCPCAPLCVSLSRVAFFPSASTLHTRSQVGPKLSYWLACLVPSCFLGNARFVHGGFVCTQPRSRLPTTHTAIHQPSSAGLCILRTRYPPRATFVCNLSSLLHGTLPAISLSRFSFALMLTTTCHRFASPLRVPSSLSKFLMRPKSKAMALYPKNKCSSS